MEEPARPRKDVEPRFGHGSQPAPEEVLYRRRQEDWLSDGSPRGRDPRSSARRAAIEVAKATLIARDALTSDHSDDVGLICTAIAGEFDMDEEARANLMAAAQLHDIGKVGIPESILQKPGPLAPDEWDVIHEHTVVGERILQAVPELRPVAGLVRHSHEHWDGSGYPDGLAGKQIPLESRIILCADAFHAVRSPRPYREGRPAEEAYAEIQAHSGHQFDPAVVDALGRTIDRVGKRRRTGRPFFSTRPVLGNRRLAALLLAMAVAGSAFAALGGRIGGGGEAEASRGPIPCQDCFGLPVSPFSDLMGAQPRATPGRRAGPSRRRAGRRGARASVPAFPGRRRSPAARSERGPAGTPPPGGGAAGGGGSPAAGGAGTAHIQPKVKKPKKTDPTPGSPPHGNAYGIERRLQNPNPPKPPPGLVKDRPNR